MIAITAHIHWIAGEPIAAALVGKGSMISAAIVAIVQAIAFMPLIITIAMISGVYGTNGWCDWFLGLGYQGDRKDSLIFSNKPERYNQLCLYNRIADSINECLMRAIGSSWFKYK